MTNLSSSKVQVHAMIGDRDGLQVKVAHSVYLELERQGGLQMAVNTILGELKESVHTTDLTFPLL